LPYHIRIEYSAPSELISVGGCIPPVSPEVIQIPPLRGEKSRWDDLFAEISIKQNESPQEQLN
jgi:hypothetical protein